MNEFRTTPRELLLALSMLASGLTATLATAQERGPLALARASYFFVSRSSIVLYLRRCRARKAFTGSGAVPLPAIRLRLGSLLARLPRNHQGSHIAASNPSLSPVTRCLLRRKDS